jgi:hypothetical protein
MLWKLESTWTLHGQLPALLFQGTQCLQRTTNCTPREFRSQHFFFFLGESRKSWQTDASERNTVHRLQRLHARKLIICLQPLCENFYLASMNVLVWVKSSHFCHIESCLQLWRLIFPVLPYLLANPYTHIYFNCAFTHALDHFNNFRNPSDTEYKAF